MANTFFQTLQSIGLPVAYGFFKSPQTPPYLVYLGSGQYDFAADDTYYHRRNGYQVEYYFTEKNEENETAIENALLAAGYPYEKSDDVYIEAEVVFVIYYTV